MPPHTKHIARLVDDSYLDPYRDAIARRAQRARALAGRLTGGKGTLADFASAHAYYGLHRTADGWVFREWAPNADAIYLIGDRTGWEKSEAYRLQRGTAPGCWELRLPADALQHGEHYRLRVHWPSGMGDRIPAYARRVVQDAHSLIFNAQVWSPAEPYVWAHPAYRRPATAPDRKSVV